MRQLEVASLSRVVLLYRRLPSGYLCRLMKNGLYLSVWRCWFFSLKLVAFKKFKDTAEALDGINHLNEGKLGKTLKKVLKSKMEENENLAVGDTKLGNIIKVSSRSALFSKFARRMLRIVYGIRLRFL